MNTKLSCWRYFYMNHTFVIKRATMDDIDSIALLFDKYRLFYKQQSNLEQATFFIENRLRNNESVIFLAKERDNPSIELGFTQLYPSFSSVSMQKLWILNDLYVDEKARKCGVAKQLLKQAAHFARQSEAKSIILETVMDNIPAQRLYESIGYEKDKDVYHYYLDLTNPS